MSRNSFSRHSGAGRNPRSLKTWIPAFAGMTSVAFRILLAAAPGASAAHAQLSSNSAPGVSNFARERVAAVPDFELPAPTFSWISSTSSAQQRELFPMWMAPLFSAVVPGTGQLRLGEGRFAAYMAVEAYGWIRYTRHRADAKRDRDAYRALAADIARSLFTSNPAIGDFDYYESMEKFIESGVFDISEEPDLQPDTSAATFNGNLWRIARETFWDDLNNPPSPSEPVYQRALIYYAERAVTSEFRWSWTDAHLLRDQYRRMIASSNDGFRRSVEDLGVIIGNHVLSMIDAFVVVRLKSSGAGTARSLSVIATLPVRVPQP